MNRVNSPTGGEKGFTLIEMLVVVAIIGILSSLVIVGLRGFQARGRDARRVSNIHQIQNTLELYYLQKGNYFVSTNDSFSGLVTALATVEPKMTNITGGENDRYHYASDDSGYDYRLGVDLEGDIGQARAVTGTEYTINCDTYYCVAP